MPSGLHVLHVESDEAYAALLATQLREWPFARFEVHRARTLAEALAWLRRDEHTDVVVLDLVLPDAQGRPTLQRIREAAPHVAVVVVTGAADEALVVDLLHEGAQDVFVKEEEQAPTWAPRHLQWAAERQRRLVRVLDRAYRDDLTGVANHRGFVVLADLLLSLARRTGLPVTVLYLEMAGLGSDGPSGQARGDLLLRRYGALLATAFRESDLIGRLLPRAFAALLLDADSGDPARRLHEMVAAARDDGSLPAAARLAVGVTSVARVGTGGVDDLLAAAKRDLRDRSG